MAKAMLAGVAIILSALVAWFIALHFAAISTATGIFFWAAILLSGFAAARIAPRSKFMVGASMALPSSLLLALSSLLFEALGHRVDFSGAGGATLIFAISLPFHAVLCATGALLGKLDLKWLS